MFLKVNFVSNLCHFSNGYVMTLIIVIRNGKIVLNHGPYCWYFRLDLKYLGWPCREYIKTAKNCDFWEKLLSEIDFEAVLATFRCYDYGANASEAVQKIATDQNNYYKRSSCVLVCWVDKIYHGTITPTYYSSMNISIKNIEKRLVTYSLGYLRRS